jgi:hypothetical protein
MAYQARNEVNIDNGVMYARHGRGAPPLSAAIKSSENQLAEVF